jgi:hypothetical protein
VISLSNQSVSTQADMIAAAEAAQPSNEALSKALEAGERNGAPALDPPKQALRPAGDKVWWYQEALGIRIPCAITADAVVYYSDLVGKYGKLDFKRYAQPSSHLDYHATVAAPQKFEHQGQTFKDVHVVNDWDGSQETLLLGSNGIAALTFCDVAIHDGAE